MKDFSISILEGMIHNARTPLNLILGYAQQLQKQGENVYLERIYKAGIAIDDIFSSTWEALQMRSAEPVSLNLNEWLNAELSLLYNHLMIKHKLIMKSEIPQEDVCCTVSPLQLSQWLEATLLCIVGSSDEGNMQAKISLHTNASLIIELYCPDGGKLINTIQQCKDNCPDFLSINTAYTGTHIALEVRIV